MTHASLIVHNGETITYLEAGSWSSRQVSGPTVIADNEMHKSIEIGIISNIISYIVG